MVIASYYCFIVFTVDALSRGSVMNQCLHLTNQNGMLVERQQIPEGSSFPKNSFSMQVHKLSFLIFKFKYLSSHRQGIMPLSMMHRPSHLFDSRLHRLLIQQAMYGAYAARSIWPLRPIKRWPFVLEGDQ